MSSTFDLAVVIGRFQPFHNGHGALLAAALETAPQVTVVLGSSLQARNAKNPFTWEERASMIAATLEPQARERVRFVPVRDCYDDRRWGEAVMAAVAPAGRVALVGYLKDASSHYLNRFPGWDFVAAPRFGDIDATSVRQIYFEGEEWAATGALLGGLVPKEIVHYLKGWARLPHFARLREEQLALEENRRVWGSGPFVTTDAVVTAAGHVLLVERGRAPGKGLWALPGGFLEPRERLMQCAIRELREETCLALLDSTLEGALKAVAVFDHPDRSLRGRTITHAHWFDLGPCRLPEVRGADDAARAEWVPVGRLPEMESRFFDDHFTILDRFLSMGGPGFLEE